MADTSTTAVKHEKYFLDTIVFSVQNTLFKVPRYHFESNSEAFSDCFSLPQGDGPKEGDNEENPLRLEGIDKVDFEHLLEVLYPLNISLNTGKNEAIDVDVTYQPRWTSVLKLSTLYRMLALRCLAIERLKDVVESDPINQIALSRLYKIPEWFEIGCKKLVERGEGISPSDAERLDYRTTYYIYRCRETHKSSGYSGGISKLGASSGSSSHDRCLTLVRTTFDDEIVELKIASQPTGSVFRDCFSLPQGKGPKEGDSEEYPLKLDGIDKVHFERLLKVLYPIDISLKTQDKTQEHDTPEEIEQWTSVLKLSTLYHMLAPRRLAIERLEKVTTHDPINQIILGRSFKIPNWFVAGCISLVKRDEGFELSDAEKLDYRTSFILYKCRETRQPYNKRNAHDYTQKISNLVYEAFKDEIEELRVASIEYGDVPSPSGAYYNYY
ncbi:hypothetical protein BDQ17DRAFT_1420066 [Cyathus striatus]|nr:hypothetical protein BDQ17DRAFT_1420066 [Cyathus striatus]